MKGKKPASRLKRCDFCTTPLEVGDRIKVNLTRKVGIVTSVDEWPIVEFELVEKPGVKLRAARSLIHYHPTKKTIADRAELARADWNERIEQDRAGTNARQYENSIPRINGMDPTTYVRTNRHLRNNHES